VVLMPASTVAIKPVILTDVVHFVSISNFQVTVHFFLIFTHSISDTRRTQQKVASVVARQSTSFDFNVFALKTSSL